MLNRRSVPLMFASLLGAACAIGAARRGPADGSATSSSFLTVPGGSLCAADSEALADARARYEALDALAEKLDPAAPPTEFVSQMEDLYQHECLAVGRGDQPDLDLELATGIEAKVYWQSGLDLWFRTYLDVADGSGNTVWLLPTRPSVVTAETRPSDPLVRWMCSADPEDPCAQRVAAWRSRAQRTFELFADGGMPGTIDCEPALTDGPKEGAYARWRACERNGLRRQASLPVGGLGPLEDGWWVVYGRRGHYVYCDELAAFDLSSGAYYRFADCAHRRGRRAAAATIEVETGTIAAELLQEAAWVAISAPYVQRNVVTDSGVGRPIPASISPVARPPTQRSFSDGGMPYGRVISSSQTTLGWIWTRASNETPAHGQLSWPDEPSEPVGDHAVRLLAFAEQRMVSGCAPMALPAWILDNLTAAQLPKLHGELVDPPSKPILEAMRRQLTRGRCTR